MTRTAWELPADFSENTVWQSSDLEAQFVSCRLKNRDPSAAFCLGLCIEQFRVRNIQSLDKFCDMDR